MNLPSRFALAATLALATAGTAEAMPAGPLASTPSLVRHTAVTVTTTMRGNGMGRRMVTRRVMRRGPFGGRSVTVTKTVR